MSSKPTTRKLRPVVMTAAVLLFTLAGYFGAYYANLAGGGQIVYLSPTGTGALWPKYTFKAREVPRYRFAQEASEVLFWPADKIDGALRPERFTEQSEWREDWWK